MPHSLFPDTTVLSCFAVVDRLDLLQAHLRGRGRVVASVAHEIRRGMERVVHLGDVDLPTWFGEIIESDADAARAIDRMRVNVFGGSPRRPFEHLGESETIHVITTNPDYAGSEFLTDDRDAADQARHRSILVRSTCDVLATLVADHEISAETAFALANDMQDAGRTLHDAPVDHRGFVR